MAKRRYNRMDQAEMDRIEALLKAHKRLLGIGGGLWPRFRSWELDRLRRELTYIKEREDGYDETKNGRLKDLEGAIRLAKRLQAEKNAEREKFRAVANECVALGATTADVLEFCRDNVFSLMRDSASLRAVKADYVTGFPGQYNDAYKTAARLKKAAQADFHRACKAERSKQYSEVEPRWWIEAARLYLGTLHERRRLLD